MIDLSEYTDFRKFLRDYASEMKKQNPNWSLAIWAKELGLSSTSSLTKILNGQREAGNKFCFKVIEYFQFSIDHAKHFDYLVFQSKTDLKKRDGTLKKNTTARKEHVDLTLSVPAEKFPVIDGMIQKLANDLHDVVGSYSHDSLPGQEFHHFNIKIWSLLKKTEGQSA